MLPANIPPMDHLYDTGPTLVAVSVLFMALCTLFVSMRMYLRWQARALGLDDYLFFLGLVLWIVSTSFVFPSAWYGMGAHAGHYTVYQAMRSGMFFFMWQVFYVWANIPIKASICLTLIRIITEQRLLQWFLYAIIGILAIMSIVVNAILLTNCSPLEATWDKTIPNANCRPLIYSLTLVNAYSGVNITIDWVLALLPIFILWKIQMRWRQKVSVMIVLSLGVIASTATIVRLYVALTFTYEFVDFLYGCAPVITWSVTELGLALIAGSVIAFRPLFTRFFGGSTARQATHSHLESGAYIQSIRLKSKHKRIESRPESAGVDENNGSGDHSESDTTGPCQTGNANESSESIMADGAGAGHTSKKQ